MPKKVRDFVNDESQRSEEDQQPETSNSNHPEVLRKIQRTPENWEVLRQNKLFTKQSVDNAELMQTVSPESEDQVLSNNFMNLQKIRTSSKIRAKRRDIQGYYYTKKGPVM